MHFAKIFASKVASMNSGRCIFFIFISICQKVEILSLSTATKGEISQGAEVAKIRRGRRGRRVA